MSENNKSEKQVIWFLPEIISILLMLLVMAALYFVYNTSLNVILQIGTFSVVSIAILGLTIRKLYPIIQGEEETSLNNLNLFWVIFIIGLVLSVVCIYIPTPAWPFTAFFVLLSIFSTPHIGLLGGSILLINAVLISGNSAGILVLYLICGFLAVSCFFPAADDEIKIAKPLFITLLGLFLCETAGIVISAEAQLSFNQFIYPIFNLIITSILIIAGIRLYAIKIKYKLRDNYQILNDTEYPLLVSLRESDKKSYKICVHTSYFCERIARRLNMSIEDLKCAGYYYRFCPTDPEARSEFFDHENFPVNVRNILTEYSNFISKKTHNRLKTRECCALLCSQTVVVAVIAMFEKNPDMNTEEQIEKLIDAAFLRYEKAGVFSYSNLTFNDLNNMKTIFKEEKLYYDFLR